MKIDRTKGVKKKRKKKKKRKNEEDYKIRTMREGIDATGINATWLDREGAFNPPVISKL